MMPLAVLVRCPATRAVMSQYVAVVSKLQARAWLLLTTVLIRACANAAPLPFELRKRSQAAEPVIMDCLLAGTLTHGGVLHVPHVPLVALSWENDFAAQGWGIVNLPLGIRGMLDYAGVMMHTNISNHYTVHFDKSARRHWAAWLREHRIPCDAKLLGAVVNAFFKGLRQFDNSPVIEEMAPADRGRVRCRLTEERARLGLAPEEQWSMKWAEENLELGIRFRLHILAEREVRNAALRAAEDEGDDADNASDDGEGIETPFQKGETVVPLATAGAIFVTCGVMEAKFVGAAALLQGGVREPVKLRRLLEDVDTARRHGAPVTALRGPGRKLWYFMFNKKKLRNVRRCKDFVLGPTIITNGVTIGVRHTTKNLAHPAGVPDLTSNKRKAALGDAQVRIRFSSAGVALRPAAARRYARQSAVGRQRGAGRGNARPRARPARGDGEASSSDSDDGSESSDGGPRSEAASRRRRGSDAARLRAASLAPSASSGPGNARARGSNSGLRPSGRSARSRRSSAAPRDNDEELDRGMSDADAPSAGVKRSRSASTMPLAAASAASGSAAGGPVAVPKRSRGAASSTGLASLMMGAHLAPASRNGGSGCGDSPGDLEDAALLDDVMGPGSSLPWQDASKPAAAAAAAPAPAVVAVSAPAAAPGAPSPSDMADDSEESARPSYVPPSLGSLQGQRRLNAAARVGLRPRGSSAASAAGGSSAASAAGGSSAASAAGVSSRGSVRSRGRGRGRGAAGRGARGGGLGRAAPEPAVAPPRVQGADARMVDGDDEVDWEAAAASAPVPRPAVTNAAYAVVLQDARNEARRLGALESAFLGNAAFIATEAAVAAGAVAAAAAPPVARPLLPVDGANDALFRDIQRALPVRWALLALAGRVLNVNPLAWPSVRDGMCPQRTTASCAAGPAAQNMDAALAGVAARWYAHERGFLATMRAAVGSGNVTDSQLRRLLGVRTHAAEDPAFDAASILHLTLLLDSVALLAASHSHEHFSPEEVFLVLRAAGHDATFDAVRAELAARAAAAAAADIRSYTPHASSLPTAQRVAAARRQVAELGGPIAVPGGAAAAATTAWQAPQGPSQEAVAAAISVRQLAVAAASSPAAAAPRAAMRRVQAAAPPGAAQHVPAAAPAAPPGAAPARVAGRAARRRAARRVSRLAGVALASRRAAAGSPLGGNGVAAAEGPAPVPSSFTAPPSAVPYRPATLSSAAPPLIAALSTGRQAAAAAAAEVAAADAAAESLAAMNAAHAAFLRHRPLSDWVVVGCDPGRVTLLAVAFRDVDGEYVYMTLSRAEYYAAMKVEQNRLRRQRWDELNPAVAPAYADLARHSPKTAGLVAIRAHVACVARHNGVLWPHALLRRNAQQRFAAFSAKRACVDKFCQRVRLVATQAGQRKMMVSYGGAKFSSTGRGDPGGAPTSWLQTRCRLNWNVGGSTFDVVDENLTSQESSITHRQLADVEDRRDGHRLEKLARQDSRASRRRARWAQAALAHAPVGGRPQQQQQPRQRLQQRRVPQQQQQQLGQQQQQLLRRQGKAAAAMLPPADALYRELRPEEAGMLLLDLEALRAVVQDSLTQSVVWAPLVAGLVGSTHATLESLLAGVALMPDVFDEDAGMGRPAVGRPAVNDGFSALRAFWAVHDPGFVARLCAAANRDQPEPHADALDQERIAGEDARDAAALRVFEATHPELRPFILAVRAFSMRATGAHFPREQIQLAAALAGRVAPGALIAALVAETVNGYVSHVSSQQLGLAGVAAARLRNMAAAVVAGVEWASGDVRRLAAVPVSDVAVRRVGPGGPAEGPVAAAGSLAASRRLHDLASLPVEAFPLSAADGLRIEQARGSAGDENERINPPGRAPLFRRDARRLRHGESSQADRVFTLWRRVHAAYAHAGQWLSTNVIDCFFKLLVQRHDARTLLRDAERAAHVVAGRPGAPPPRLLPVHVFDTSFWTRLTQVGPQCNAQYRVARGIYHQRPRPLCRRSAEC